MPPSLSSLPLRIGTRGSKLARAQANGVRDSLLRGGAAVAELVVITTSGDRIRDRPLAEFGGKGLFAKEIEEALLAERIDLAVHSMKDLPVILPAGLILAATPQREVALDVFVSQKAARIEALAPQARIGTSSVRRSAQIARCRPDLRIVSLRGNVDTRLAKLEAGDIDAIVLAAAGLRRLGIGDRRAVELSGEAWLPALGQGALAIEMRAGDARAERVHAALNDEASAIASACERGFQEALGGSCRTSIAGLATWRGGRLRFSGEVLAPDGSDSVRTSLDIVLSEAAADAARRAGFDVGLAIKPRAQRWLTL